MQNKNTIVDLLKRKPQRDASETVAEVLKRSRGKDFLRKLEVVVRQPAPLHELKEELVEVLKDFEIPVPEVVEQLAPQAPQVPDRMDELLRKLDGVITMNLDRLEDSTTLDIHRDVLGLVKRVLEAPAPTVEVTVPPAVIEIKAGPKKVKAHQIVRDHNQLIVSAVFEETN